MVSWGCAKGWADSRLKAGPVLELWRYPGSRPNTHDDLWNSIKHGSCSDTCAVGTPVGSVRKAHVCRDGVGGQDE